MVKRTDQTNDEEKTKSSEAKDSLGIDQVSSAKITDKKVGDVDPLTKETREQISSKQLSALQDLISKNEEDEEKKKKLQNLNPNQFRDFLRDNKELTEKAFKDQEFVGRLNNIEIQGYRGLAEKFKDQLQPLKWDGPTGENSRSQEIKDAGGKIITTLTEKTIKTPTTIQNEKGENI